MKWVLIFHLWYNGTSIPPTMTHQRLTTRINCIDLGRKTVDFARAWEVTDVHVSFQCKIQ